MRKYNGRLLMMALLLSAIAICFFTIVFTGASYQLARPNARIYALIFSIFISCTAAANFYYGLKPGLRLKTGWTEISIVSGLGLFLLFAITPLNSSAFANGDLLSANTGYFYFGSGPSASSDSVLADFQAKNAENGMAQAEVSPDGSLVINSQYFVNMVDDLYLNLDDYLGKKVRIQGFGIRMKNFTDRQIVVSRYVMTCCAADASGVGLMIEGDEVANFKEDDWMDAEGTIDFVDYDGDRIPLIHITKLTPMKPLSNKYVYYQQ